MENDLGEREERRRRFIAHYTGMAKEVNARLSDEQKVAIRGLTPTLLKRRVPDYLLDQLVALDLVERKLGGPCLTTLGEFVARLNERRF
jgi:hypothetical protein